MKPSLNESDDSQLTIEQGNIIVNGVFKKYVELHYRVQALLPDEKREPARGAYPRCLTLPECARTISWIEEYMVKLREQERDLKENSAAEVQKATQRLLNSAATYNLDY